VPVRECASADSREWLFRVLDETIAIQEDLRDLHEKNEEVSNLLAEPIADLGDDVRSCTRVCMCNALMDSPCRMSCWRS
jgi:hypothetical protein